MSAKKKQKPQAEAKGIATLRTSDWFGAAIRKSVKKQMEDSANTIAREVADWIAEDGVLDVRLMPWGIEIWVNGDPAKDVKWGNLLEKGITDAFESDCHKESPKEWAALSAKLKRAAKLIDDAIAPNDPSSATAREGALSATKTNK